MKRALALLAVLLLAAAPAALADFGQTFTGTNAGGPTFNRPSTTTTLSGMNTHYASQVFVLSENANCYLVSVQDYDGHIALYRSSFNPASPLTNLVDLDDDGELSVGTSRIPSDLNMASVNLTAGTYYLVTSAFASSGIGSFTNTLHCSSAQPLQGPCYFSGSPREKNVCFFNRFASKESAFFWFYTDQNFEVMIKVLDACGINGRYWVFAGALTNQGYRIRVGDVQTQQVRNYTNAQGTNAAAVTDTTGFPCNP
jgi:hypothetical protein